MELLSIMSNDGYLYQWFRTLGFGYENTNDLTTFVSVITDTDITETESYILITAAIYSRLKITNLLEDICLYV
jgi:hypothetical protein